MDEHETKALADIETFGCHIIHVLEEREAPPFSYSIGIERTNGAPELIVVGLKRDLAHFAINEYNRLVKAGSAPAHGSSHGGFLEGFDVRFLRVERRHYPDYFGWALWLYGGQTFGALQLVYPTTDGVWPWDATAAQSFLDWQPCLFDVEDLRP